MGALLELRRPDQQAFAILEVRREVHRLQRGMREQGRDVFRRDGFCRSLHGAGDIASRFDRQDFFLGGSRAYAGQHAGGGQRRAAAFIPHDGQCFTRFFRAPVTVRHDGDAIGNLHDIEHAGHGARPGRIKTLDGAANDRALLQRGVDHARQFHVDAEFRRAIDF